MNNPSIRFNGYTEDLKKHKLEELLLERNVQHSKSEEFPLVSFTVENGVTLKTERYDREQLVSGDKSTKKYKETRLDDIVYNPANLKFGAISRNKLGNAVFSPIYVTFEVKKDLVKPSFMEMVVTRENFIQKALKYQQGTVYERMSVNTDDFINLDVSIPNCCEQEKLGKYFDYFNNLLTLQQQKCENIKKLKKYMLQKMFPEEGKSVPKIRFAEFTNPWEQRKLSDVATMHARIGWQNLRTSEFLDSGDYMLITGTDFNDGAVNYSTCHFVEKERYEQDKHIQIKNGSILITKDGTLGKVAYVQGLSMPATLNAGVFNVEIKDETKVDNKYLFQYLKAPFLMDYVDKKATGGTIKHLNQNILVDFPVVMPSKAEQEAIGVYFQQLDNLITLHQRKLDKLKQIKKALLNKMFV